MLIEYPGNVTVKIDGMAASAASVIAMAGTRVLMSPTSLMMIHNPLTVAMGDTSEMKRAIQLLDEVKESIINAYELRCNLPREKLAQLMDAETWISAKKALDMGFIDEILVRDVEESTVDDLLEQALSHLENYSTSCFVVTNNLLDKLKAKQAKSTPVQPPSKNDTPPTNGTPVADLDKRLALLFSAPCGY